MRRCPSNEILIFLGLSQNFYSNQNATQSWEGWVGTCFSRRVGLYFLLHEVWWGTCICIYIRLLFDWPHVLSIYKLHCYISVVDPVWEWGFAPGTDPYNVRICKIVPTDPRKGSAGSATACVWDLFLCCLQPSANMPLMQPSTSWKKKNTTLRD